MDYAWYMFPVQCEEFRIHHLTLIEGCVPYALRVRWGPYALTVPYAHLLVLVLRTWSDVFFFNLGLKGSKGFLREVYFEGHWSLQILKNTDGSQFEAPGWSLLSLCRERIAGFAIQTSDWGYFWAQIIGWDPSVCKSNRLHVDILRFSFIKLGYIPYILLKWSVIFPAVLNFKLNRFICN